MKGERTHVLSQGLVAGVIGYAAVALFFLVADLMIGRPAFYTPALLGGALFYGLGDPAQTVVWPGPVLAFNGVHLVLFLALGLIAGWLAEISERGPQLWYVGLVLFILVLFHIQGLVLVLTDRVRTALSPWLVLAAGLSAAVAMGAYLVRVHPRLRAELGQYRD
jgi:hypothetical protein